VPRPHRQTFVERWLTRLLFRLTILVAAALGAFVLVAPFLTGEPGRDTWSAICYLFAQDGTLRKTAIISAVGLWVTAVVFFREPDPRTWDWNRRRYVSPL
jgi:hypothetical protein